MPAADHTDRPGAGPGQLGELATAIDSMVGLLRGQLERADARADAAQTRIAALEAVLQAKDVAIAEAEHAARIATDALKAARQAEEARRGRGRLRRAWNGWRGR
jgi:hypothetical protein